MAKAAKLVKHRSGPVRTVGNVRDNHGTRKMGTNSADAPTKRGVRSPANVKVSGVPASSTSGSSAKSSVTGGVRSTPRSARQPF